MYISSLCFMKLNKTGAGAMNHLDSSKNALDRARQTRPSHLNGILETQQWSVYQAHCMLLETTRKLMADMKGRNARHK